MLKVVTQQLTCMELPIGLLIVLYTHMYIYVYIYTVYIYTVCIYTENIYYIYTEN